MELYINTQGLIRAIYDESLAFQCLGSVQIQRASHVEADNTGNWWADLAPSGGPILGPFPLRSTALDAEQQWLTQHVLASANDPSPERPELLYDELPRPEAQPTSHSPEQTAFQTSAGRSDLL